MPWHSPARPGRPKVRKAEVNYRRRAPRARRKCANCSMAHFFSSLGGSCTLVAGIIERNDVCDRWEAKK